MLLLNHFIYIYIYISENLLPVYSPSGITRASHSIQLIRPYARMNLYLNPFFPHTISDWNNFQMNFLSIEDFKDFSVNLFQSM